MEKSVPKLKRNKFTFSTISYNSYVEYITFSVHTYVSTYETNSIVVDERREQITWSIGIFNPQGQGVIFLG